MPLLRILTYHRIGLPGDADDLDPKLISAIPAVFEAHMRILQRYYTVVDAQQVLMATEHPHLLPDRAVWLTFDDAYHDFLDVAWPILESLRLPFTLFVPTAYPDTRRQFWWDRLYRAFMQTRRWMPLHSPIGQFEDGSPAGRLAALRAVQAWLKTLDHDQAMQWVDELCNRLQEPPYAQPSVLSWEALRRLQARGATIAAHSRTHPLLGRLEASRLDDEIHGSLEDLRRELGTVLPIFCYPGGSYSQPVLEAVRRAGIRLAVTTLDGHNELDHCDVLQLRRTNVTRRTSPWLLRLRLTRWFAIVDQLRHGTRRAELRVQASETPLNPAYMDW